MILDAKIPANLSDRPRWTVRGVDVAIPYTALVVDGVPDFRVNDQRKVITCIKQRRCALCGKPFAGAAMWFTGGEKCRDHRHFFDPPAHEECLLYAYRVCPYLLNPKHTYSDRPVATKGAIVQSQVSQIVSTERPSVMYLMKAAGYQIVHHQGEMLFHADDWLEVVADCELAKR